MTDENNTDVLSKRPWKNSSIELTTRMPNGENATCHALSVVDANGDVVCYGNSADMEFIVDMENSLDEILRYVESQGESARGFIERFGKFKADRRKSFIYN